MKISRDQVEANRRRIVEAAGRLFRARGIDAVSIAEVMQAAGLTHGGFYNHFRSKAALAEAALGEIDEVGPGGATGYADRYLSRRHRDDAERGCVFAALASEVARGEEGARAALTGRLRRGVDRLAREAEGETPAARRQAAVAAWAGMVGGLILARMVDDAVLSDEILRDTRAALPLRGDGGG